MSSIRYMHKQRYKKYIDFLLNFFQAAELSEFLDINRKTLFLWVTNKHIPNTRNRRKTFSLYYDFYHKEVLKEPEFMEKVRSFKNGL